MKAAPLAHRPDRVRHGFFGCVRAPRAPMPSPACARKGRNGVPDQLQGREGVLGGREGTPISANLPRFCPTPVSASSPAGLGRGCRASGWANLHAQSTTRRLGMCSPVRYRPRAAHLSLQLRRRSSSAHPEAERQLDARACCRSRRPTVGHRQLKPPPQWRTAPARPFALHDLAGRVKCTSPWLAGAGTPAGPVQQFLRPLSVTALYPTVSSGPLF